MKPCIHSAGKRTLHPNSTLLCHVHFLSSVLSCRVFTFKVFLVISEPDKRGYVRYFAWQVLFDTFDEGKSFYLFPIIRVLYKSIEAKPKQNAELNNSPVKT